MKKSATAGVMPDGHSFRFKPGRQAIRLATGKCSADFAQAGRGNAQGRWFAHHLDLYHDSPFAILHLVESLDAGKRAVSQQNPVAGSEKALRLGVMSLLLLFQQFDQLIVDFGRFGPEADQAAHALGGPDRTPAFSGDALTKMNEKVARKQRFVDDCQPPEAQLFSRKNGQITRLPLLLEV